MRVHISLDDALVRELDRRVGARRRSSFIATAVAEALEDEKRWESIAAAIGSVSGGHAWDKDPSSWVREQRRNDERRIG
jgi:metal-responsive CopG/Arc/MetJ family transcriptional regulator